MIRNDLRNPIAKTILLIAVITLIILFSFNAPPGSGVWGTLSAILSGIFTTIKVVIGLGAAFAVSILLFVVIFALSVAIISREDAVKVINAVTFRLVGKEFFRQPGPSLEKKSPGGEVSHETTGGGTVGEKSEVESEGKLKGHLERQIRHVLNAKQKMTEEISALRERFGKLTGEVKGLKDQSRRDELDENITEIKEDINTLQQGVGEAREELAHLRKQLAEMTAGTVGNRKTKLPEGDHRIFEYLSRKTDQQKLTELTQKTVEQGMSYAEAIKFITGNMPSEAAEVVDAHPTLTREFIKSCRDQASGKA